MANTDLVLGCDSEFAYLPLMNKNTDLILSKEEQNKHLNNLTFTFLGIWEYKKQSIRY